MDAGGFEGNAPLDSVVSLDVATGVWHTEASLPTARALLSAVALEGAPALTDAHCAPEGWFLPS